MAYDSEQYVRRLKYFKEMLLATSIEQAQRGREADAAPSPLSPVNVLVSISARAHSRVYTGILKSIAKMTEHDRNAHAITGMLKLQITNYMAAQAIEFADNGLPRNEVEREEALQTLGAYGRALEMLRESSRRQGAYS